MIPHDLCRKKVCLLCFHKTDLNKDPKLDISKRPDLISLIDKHILPGFDNADLRLPAAFCKSCYNRLSDMTSLSPRTDDCSCQICIIGNSVGLEYTKLMKSLQPNKVKPSPDENKNKRLCSKCLTLLYR